MNLQLQRLLFDIRSVDASFCWDRNITCVSTLCVFLWGVRLIPPAKYNISPHCNWKQIHFCSACGLWLGVGAFTRRDLAPNCRYKLISLNVFDPLACYTLSVAVMFLSVLHWLYMGREAGEHMRVITRVNFMDLLTWRCKGGRKWAGEHASNFILFFRLCFQHILKRKVLFSYPPAKVEVPTMFAVCTKHPKKSSSVSATSLNTQDPCFTGSKAGVWVNHRRKHTAMTCRSLECTLLFMYMCSVTGCCVRTFG